MHPGSATAWWNGRSAVAAALVALGVVAAACAPAAPTTVAASGSSTGSVTPVLFATPPANVAPLSIGPDGPLGVVRGLLTDVQPASIAILREVELRSDDGQVLRFAIEGDTGITPGHAREHMVNAEPVTITYRSTPEGRVALRIDD